MNNNKSSSKSTSTSSSNSTGGNSASNATGGAGGTGGSVNGSGNSTATLANSGNSTNTNTASGGNQKQGQTQSAQGGSATGGASNQSQSAVATSNGDNSNNYNSTVNMPRQVASAIAPDVLPSAPCFKGFSGAAQTPLLGASFGAGKIDKGCDSRETARSFASLGNRLAAATILCKTDAAKRAGLTLADCLTFVVAPAPVIIQAPTPQPVQAPQEINITVLPAPVVVQQVSTPAPIIVVPEPKRPAVRRVPSSHTGCPTPKADLCTPKKAEIVWDEKTIWAMRVAEDRIE
jgi:hypothetical protein